MPTSRMQNPRVTKESHNVNDFFFAKIDNTVDNSLPVEIIEEYNNNMKEQANNYCFRKLPNGYDTNNTENDNVMIQLMRFILTDSCANCSKPEPASVNERTPYVEYVVPIFKYFSAATKLMAFVSCEKGLVVCMPGDSTKNILGAAVEDSLKRILMESSGEVDDEDTIEDTIEDIIEDIIGIIKLMERGAKCLEEEMNRYR
ncbi:hypothetical protein EDC94DRAFT_677031 [Helicostylum pulchrum]|nr:hypothetical protein EDC94DRAFT_677031 [Helicostylum pulchrum]